MKLLGKAGIVLILLAVAGCKQATTGLPSIHTSASAEALANAAFDAANAALPLVYNNNDSTGTFSPAAGLIASGTSTSAASVYTFTETVSMTDYDPNATGIFAELDGTGVVMKGTRTAAGVGSYTYTGGVFLSGTAPGHVLFNLSLSSTATTLQYSGSVTVNGVGYDYSGSQ